MVNVTQLERRIAKLERQLEASTRAIAEYTTLANVQANGFDQVNVAADEQNQKQRPVKRFSPWGLASRPVVGTLVGLVKAVAGAFNGMVFGVTTDKYGPQDLEDGETCLYNKGDARVFLDQDDKITVSSSTTIITLTKDGDCTIDAPAGLIKLAGGTLAIARQTDQVTGTAGPYPIINGIIATGSAKAFSG